MTSVEPVLGFAMLPEANSNKFNFRSVTFRYLSCKQRIQAAVDDKIGIEPPD